MSFDESRLPPGWLPFFQQELTKHYMLKLKAAIQHQINNGVKIWPMPRDIFKAYELTGLVDIRVVLVGQDPYPTAGFAHGLSFSVNEGVPLPASLRNIFSELERDLRVPPPASGNLEAWARRGVLLLNSILTVVENKRKSHESIGWSSFTEATIKEINKLEHGVVFLAWGGAFHEVCELVDESKHKVIRTSHPSNTHDACNRFGYTKSGKKFQAFNGSFCFSQANNWLVDNGHEPLNWEL
ncbi:uracil-DNA glycosylase [Shewanella oncorhynchi]|uniref:uracil-DNA glycosylase n=1 Tax=Shewanella oncorhynchi TaxID=2726434 RepID=UPI003D7B0197